MTTVKGLATRARIVEAAAGEVRDNGANAVTLDDVCRRSGTGKGQLFHHFPGGREQLMLAVAELEAALVFDDQEPYLSQLTSAASWRAWCDLMITRYRDQGVNCPLAVLIADVGRYSPAAQDVAAQLVRRWQACLREGIVATQAVGEADPGVNADRVAAAFIAAIQGGVTVLISTGSSEHLEAGLALCLEHLLTQTPVQVV
ncbi:TetR/AcrR family transcriptional regulator [Kineosporia sp. NBRC 101731]|uniref:TetR/AcrR family transcriptional regulator n=1 Tax=Kineosporia sp. NBRC 101731 TaxID=3032199 RepID=UPI0024A34844|nr:TetR/AcrR family transcriptional regulator [Kineosporia sp. NBRC 101731]GLY30726.1 TetR family transcriptional regulator [Kineosporia sp. NBRC 101731]